MINQFESRLQPYGDSASFAYPVTSRLGWNQFERSKLGVEETIKQVKERVSRLLEDGDYAGLVATQSEIEGQITSLDPVEVMRVKGALVGKWLIETHQLTRNAEKTDPLPKSLSQASIVTKGTIDEQTYRDVAKIWSIMSRFKAGEVSVQEFHSIEQLNIFSRYGFLSPENAYDSAYQQSRIVMLSMLGLNYDQLYSVMAYAQEERSSRAKTGKLPAIMMRAIVNHEGILTEMQRETLARRAIYNWGTPGEKTTKTILATRRDRINRFNQAKAVVLQGGAVPANYGLSASSLYRLNRLYKALHPSWQAPHRLDPQTGNVVDQESNVVKVADLREQSSDYVRNKYGILELIDVKSESTLPQRVTQMILGIINHFASK